MAYVIGTAASIAELLSAIQNACTANGWTLSGNVLHKGTCYVEILISGSVILAQGGGGIDGSNNLTGVSNGGQAALGRSFAGAGGSSIVAFGWPVTYEIFIGTAPDEVYVVCNYAVSYYQQLSFGQSKMLGLNGTGNWYSGCGNGDHYGGYSSQGEYGDNNYLGTGLYMRSYESYHGVDHKLDSDTWIVRNADGNIGTNVNDATAILHRQPNQWNGESILIPIRVYASRGSGFLSPVLECAHARYINIASVNDGQIITLGSDKWKVYPFWHRGTSSVTGGANDSWYAGHAFRYDGD